MPKTRDTVSLECVLIDNPAGHNLIFGQSHFIKTVEDIHETLAECMPGISFGLAFTEASGSRLIRKSGTKAELVKLAADNLRVIGCGHTFLIFLENAFPINVLGAVRNVSEVVNLFCATANPVQVIIARTKQGGGVLGVVDGGAPAGIETAGDAGQRYAFLRKIGYKLP